MKRRLLLALLPLALGSCGTPGTVSFGGYAPPVAALPAPVPTATVSTGSADVMVFAPQGTTPQITLSAGSNREHTVTGMGMHHVPDLTPGTYSVSSSSLRADGFTFTPHVSSNPLVIQADRTATTTVRYLPIGGQLAVNVQAVRDVSPSVHITGPGSYTRTVTRTGTTAFGDLLPGVYTLTADARIANGRSYTPTILQTSADIQAGVTRAVGVTYAAAAGTVRVSIGGLPAGTRAQARLNGPGLDLSLQDSTELAGLAPGDYTLTAGAVDSEQGMYTPDQATRMLTVTNAQFTDANLTYTRN